MLIYCREDEKTNNIHLIIGEESELNYTLFGHLSFNLNDHIKYINKKKSINIIITRVQSEQYAGQHLNHLQMHDHQMHMMKDLQQFMQTKDQKLDKQTLEQGTFIADVLCPKCGNHGVYIKKDQPCLCHTCLEIEKGLKEKKKKEKSETGDEKL